MCEKIIKYYPAEWKDAAWSVDWINRHPELMRGPGSKKRPLKDKLIPA